jgi:hypothetical protein
MISKTIIAVTTQLRHPALKNAPIAETKNGSAAPTQRYTFHLSLLNAHAASARPMLIKEKAATDGRMPLLYSLL